MGCCEDVVVDQLRDWIMNGIEVVVELADLREFMYDCGKTGVSVEHG